MTDPKEFSLHAHPVVLGAFRQDLGTWLEASGLEEKTRSGVILAVHEAQTTIISHAYQGKEGEIHIRLSDFGDRVEIRIRDFGVQFDPSQVEDPELPPTKPGGLGIFMIRRLMDKAEYNCGCAGGNELLLTKYK